MKKIFLLTIISIITVLTIYSQTVSDVAFVQKGQKIEVNYSLKGAKFNQKFNVSLYVSTNGGKVYTGPLVNVSGDVGTSVESGLNKKILWDVYQEMPGFGGQVVFDVKALVIEEKIKPQLYVGLRGSQTAPIGIVAGLTGKVGFYASIRMNPGLLKKSDYETNGTIVTNYTGKGYYSFTSNESTQRLSATAGLQFQTGKKVHLYLGGGFAKYNLLWEFRETQYSSIVSGKAWAKHTGESFLGAEAEAGIFVQFKHIFVSLGASSPGFKWVDGMLGLGYIF
jgi:opacity protein-like surface antigen